MAAILNSSILVLAILHKKMSLIHSDFTWWWQPSWILPTWIQPLPFWIQTPCYLISDSLKNTLPPLWLWLKLIQSDSNSFVLTQLDYGSHLEFYHLGFSFCHLWNSAILVFFLSNSLKNTLTQDLVPTIYTNSNSLKLIHSHSTWWWQLSWILLCWIKTLPSWNLPP